jgi:NAD-dependent DNA ligase
LYEIGIGEIELGECLKFSEQARAAYNKELRMFRKLFGERSGLEGDDLSVAKKLWSNRIVVSPDDGRPPVEVRPYRSALKLWETEHGVELIDAEDDSVNAHDGSRLVEAVLSMAKAGLKSAQKGKTSRQFRRVSAVKGRGNVIVISGTVEGLNRDEAKAKATEMGYEVMDSVSGSIDILVVGESPGPSKVKKAEKLGIRIIPFSDLKRFEG